MAQYFNLTLDTTAPSGGSLSGLQNYYKENATVTIAAENASYMKIWTDQKENGVATDAPNTWEAYSNSKSVSFSAQGTNYVHALFMDEVGNISSVVNSGAIIYDTVAPAISSVSINNGDGYTKVASNTVRVSFSDATSGVQKITLSGDILSTESKDYILTVADRTAGYKDFTVTFSAPDGQKTVTAIATDLAGNQSGFSSDTIVYDTTVAVITPVLRESDDSAVLPAFVNYTSYGVRIITDSTDITHYKIWEGNTEPSSWNPIANATPINGVGYFIGDLVLSSNDEEKIIHVKIQDVAGNTVEGTPLIVTLDTTAPTVTLTSDVSIISAQTGYNTVTFSCSAIDTNSAQGLNYELKIGSNIIKSGIFSSSVAVTQSEINAIFSGDGKYTFKLYVTDIAGNIGESNTIDIYIDTDSPRIAVTPRDSRSNTVSVTLFDAHFGTSYAPIDGVKLWYDNNLEPTVWDNFNSTMTIQNVPEGTHTLYYKIKDSVNNIATGQSQRDFIVDMTPPTGTISTVSYTNSRNIILNLSASDSSYTFDSEYSIEMKVWENGTTEPSDWEDYSITKSLVLTTGDGVKTINVKFKDGLGNESASVAATCSTILDTDAPDVTLTLIKPAFDVPLAAKTHIQSFTARIGFTNENQDSPIVEYKLTGDFEPETKNNEWLSYELEEGKNYMKVEFLAFTDEEGLKTVTAYLKDAAGNISATPASVTVYYDTSNPIIDVNAPDYNIISKQHTNRINSLGAIISGKYNDVCTFTWSANEPLQSFKVCVNEVGQGVTTANAIGTLYGSQNMSGGMIEANTDVTSVIFGADLAATEEVNDTDGAYEIIVYGKDESGRWSAVHPLS